MPAGNPLSRRHFACLVGAGGAAALLAPLVAARGGEERLALRAGADPEPAKLLPKDPANLILLNSNENPYGPSPRALEAMTEAHSVAMRYPDFWADQLQDKLAAFHGVDTEMVVVTCGSTELLKLAAQAFLGPGRRLVVAEPTFEAVVYYGRQTGAEVVKVPLTADYRHDLEAMARAARARPGLIYLCNPNNPTGTLNPEREVEAFLADVPRDSVVLADEAYFHYVEDPGYGTVLPRVQAGENIVLARTFSKIYGLAGLRLGYGIAPRGLMQQMRPHQVLVSWNVIACAAALATLDDADWVTLNRKRNRETRDYLVEEMARRGRASIPSHTNFVCVHVGRPVRPVIAAFREHGLSVGRPFTGLPQHIRVSLGSSEEMEKFVAAFDKVLARARQRGAELAGREPQERRLPGAAPLWARN
ncbi:MAG: pyridoxal phosphate-dependent aminotransferase [Terriglobia bacterium]